MPRAETGVESVWEEHPSSEDYVYLTTAYATYFALNATAVGERWAVLEIDSDLLDDPNAIVPDEDFLEQATRGQDLPEEWELQGTSLKERTTWFREHLFLFGHLWKESVKHMGNCAYGDVIPPQAITRVAFITPKENLFVYWSTDPTISLINYMICGQKYRALIGWIMGDEAEPEEFILGPGLPGQLEQLQDALSDRTGIEVEALHVVTGEE